LTDKLFGSRQKENVALLANVPSGKSRHVASHYQQTSKTKSFAEQIATWQTHEKGMILCKNLLHPIQQLFLFFMLHCLP